MESGTLYHVSPTPGLTLLRPRVSSHQKAYVYALRDLATALLFGARKDDFDFRMDVDAEGKPVIWECYPGAFPKIYQGKGCSVYEVDASGFQSGVTGWEPELVCGREVAVRKETAVPDLYARLLEAAARGELTIHRYNDGPEYKKLIAEHIVDRLIRFDLLERFDQTDPRGALYFRGLIDGLKNVLDGHLL